MGGIPILLQLIGSEPINRAVAVTALACAVVAGDEYARAAVAAGAAPVLARRLLSGGPFVLQRVGSAIGNLAAGGPVCCAALVAAGVVPPLVQLLSHDATRLQAAAALASLAAYGDHQHRQAVVAAGAIPCLERCLQAADNPAAACAARALAALAAGNPEHALAVTTAGNEPILRRLLQTSSDEVQPIAGQTLDACASAQAQQPAPAADQPPPAATGSAAPVAPRVCAAPGCACGLHRCSACRTVPYCSQACIRAHWRQHKAECRRVQVEQAQAGCGGGDAAAVGSVGSAEVAVVFLMPCHLPLHALAAFLQLHRRCSSMPT